MAAECSHQSTRVLETRTDGGVIYRRRECNHCGKRFATAERPFDGPVSDKKAAAKKRTARAVAGGKPATLWQAWGSGNAAQK